MGMESPAILHMLIEKALPYPIREPEALPGYTALNVTERQRFGEYALFQLAFAMHVLEKLECSHNDLAKPDTITANMLFDALDEGSDPCAAPAPSPPGRGAACPWGHCWTADGRSWCFDRATTPLMRFVVKIFDFGMARCRPSREQSAW